MNLIKQDTVAICYYSSDYYAPYTGISMYSLCKTNVGVDFDIYCIDTGISDENKAKMNKMAEEFNRNLTFLDFKEIEDYIKNELKLPICSGSYATYIKIFPEKIFGDKGKILFMDGDTIIDGSLKELMELDMSDSVFAAAKVSLITENRVYERNDLNNLRYKYALKFHDFGYRNIGVFLINLEKWNEVNLGEKILDTQKRYGEDIQRGADVPYDEMILNLTALDYQDTVHVQDFSPIYNSTVHNIPYKRGYEVNMRCGYISEKDFNDAFYNPVVIHYCIFKPWYVDAYSKHKSKVGKYKKVSPWPDAFEENLYKTWTDRYWGNFIHRLDSEKKQDKWIAFGHWMIRTYHKLFDRLLAKKAN